MSKYRLKCLNFWIAESSLPESQKLWWEITVLVRIAECLEMKKVSAVTWISFALLSRQCKRNPPETYRGLPQASHRKKGWVQIYLNESLVVNTTVFLFLVVFCFCLFNAFLLSRCIWFCNLQCDASLLALSFSLSITEICLHSIYGIVNIRRMKVPESV